MGKLIPFDLQMTPAETVLIQLAVGFLAGGVAFIMIVFFARVWKSNRKRKSQLYQARFRNILNDMVVSDSVFHAHNPPSAVDYKVAELSRLQQRAFSRQILLDQIVDMKRNLSGNSVKTLKMLYVRLELYSVSLRKLNSLSSNTKARGIRELAMMGYISAYKEVSRYLTSRNRILREEATLASLELSPGDPLAFLTDYRYDITLWMRMQLHRHLQKLDPRTVPDFTKWFDHPNVTVVLFSISMARAFQQTKSIPGLIKLLDHFDERVVSSAVETMAALEAFECVDTVGDMAQRYFASAKISRRIANCLGVIGTLEKHSRVLLHYIHHHSYDVRFTAVRSLTRLGLAPALLLTQCGHGQEEIRLILQHLSEPLLH